MAGIELLHVPYKSNPLAITDMLGGTIDMMITDTTTGLPQVQAGKLRALGYSGDKRSRLAPDLPTISEAGVKGYEMSYWFAAYAPAGTPPAVVKRLNALLVAATRSAPRHRLLREDRRRRVLHHARRTRQVPARRDQEVGRDHQEGQHPARMTDRAGRARYMYRDAQRVACFGGGEGKMTTGPRAATPGGT